MNEQIEVICKVLKSVPLGTVIRLRDVTYLANEILGHKRNACKKSLVEAIIRGIKYSGIPIFQQVNRHSESYKKIIDAPEYEVTTKMLRSVL